jgi:hypothetical protein
MFFEKNQWVFGYGLSYFFVTGFKDRKLEQMVQGLERRYDAYMAGRDPEDGSYDEGGFNERDLPSADELAAELERYLASRPSGDDDKTGRG